MKIQFSVPSKTFLLGEYCVLAGGPGLLLSTPPRFELTLKQGQPKPLGFSAKNPAASLFAAHAKLFQEIEITITDPHQGKGGFGFSSAQFLLLYAAIHALHQKQNPAFSFKDLLFTYRQHQQIRQPYPPSGADLAAQYTGNLTWFDPTAITAHAFSWPFPSLSYCILRTGYKLATHEHLATLSSFNPSPFKKILATTQKCLETADASQFCDQINAYANALDIAGLVTPDTQRLLNSLKSHPSVLAAKGCGAMGADVIFVLCESNRITHLTSWIEENHLELTAFGQTVSQGFSICNGEVARRATSR